MSRSFVTASLAAAALLAGCSAGARPNEAERSRLAPSRESSLATVVAGPWRSDAERAQDVWRRPEATLQFLGLRPGQTVVEVWPGAGGCTQILAPYVARTRGRLYAVHPSVGTTGSDGEALLHHFRERLGDRPDLYGQVLEGRFGARPGDFGPSAGSADLVLFPDRLHYWMAAGLAEAAFAEAYAALKPGGVLGVIQTRATPEGAQDPLARNGAVQEGFVNLLAREAGFQLDAPAMITHRELGDASRGVGMTLRFRKGPPPRNGRCAPAVWNTPPAVSGCPARL